MEGSPLRELLAVDHRRALEFFVVGLRDVSEPDVDHQELLYNSSILAHYSQVSTVSETEFPTPSNLSAVFDNFVVEGIPSFQVEMIEVAGTHCLLMAGFFEDQMRSKYNVSWYSRLGAGFYFRASKLERFEKKAKLLYRMARNFELWRQRHSRLQRELQATPYLLSLPTPRVQ